MAYELLKSNVIYSGRVFRVVSRQVRLPDGRAQDYDIVEHNGAVTILPLDADGNLIFVRQYRVGATAELLELPAGVLHDGEDPALGAAREVREETGCAAEQLISLGGFYMAPGYSSEYMHVFLATGLSNDPLPQDDDEFLQVERIPAARAMEMAHNAEIQDGKTLVSLMLASAYLTPLGKV